MDKNTKTGIKIGAVGLSTLIVGMIVYDISSSKPYRDAKSIVIEAQRLNAEERGSERSVKLDNLVQRAEHLHNFVHNEHSNDSNMVAWTDYALRTAGKYADFAGTNHSDVLRD